MRDLGLIVPGRPSPAPQSAPAPVVQQPPVVVTSTVKTAPVTETAKGYLMKEPGAWTWEDLRDYVITSATERFGAQLRSPVKEKAVFSSFLNRYGAERAVLVAMAAFQVYEGMWASAPIGVNRFCKNSDPYFSDVILAQLEG